MRRVRGLRLVACLALGLALMVFAAPAFGANASVRAYGAVAGTARFTLKVDGKNRAVRLGFETGHQALRPRTRRAHGLRAQRSAASAWPACR